MKHYCQFWPQSHRAYACGGLNTGNGSYTPAEVDCEQCRQTEVWQADTTTIEIGYDGNDKKWFLEKKRGGE